MRQALKRVTSNKGAPGDRRDERRATPRLPAAALAQGPQRPIGGHLQAAVGTAGGNP